MIYKYKFGLDVIYFGHISHDHKGSSKDLFLQLDNEFDPNDALYSFHNISMIMLRYNNREDNYDWDIDYIENDFLDFEDIHNIPDDEWYSWKQISWLLDEKGFMPHSQDDFRMVVEGDDLIKFNRLGIRSV